MIRIILFLLILVLSPGAWAAGTAGEGGGQFTSDDPAYAEAIQAIKAQEFDRAARLLQDVVDRNPDNIDALSSLGYANTRLGRYDQAKRRYARALALQPGHLGARETWRRRWNSLIPSAISAVRDVKNTRIWRAPLPVTAKPAASRNIIRERMSNDVGSAS